MSIEEQLSACTILMVDDEEANLDLLEGFLGMEGYRALVRTSDSREAMALFEQNAPDLVLLDLHMPHRDGFALLREICERIPEGDYLPVLVLTADVTSESRERALSEGARDFLTKPLDGTEVLLRVRNLLETRTLYQRQRAAREAAEAAERRAAFLAEASRVLSTSFDYATTLSQLARLAVPRLADFCVVDLLELDGTFTRLAVAHVDPAKEAILLHGAPTRGVVEHPLGAVFQRGQAVLVQEVTAAEIDRYYGQDERRQLVDMLAPRSAMAIPLEVSGRLIGGLTLGCAESDRCFGPEDLDLAEALARRAALAVDNARLFLRAQEATRARDHVLAVVAHDLRNPLGTITMGASLLQEMLDADDSRKDERQHLGIIVRSAERMNRLIQDLLDLSRMEASGLALELRTEDLDALLTEAAAMLRPLAEARRIRLQDDGCRGLPPGARRWNPSPPGDLQPGGERNQVHAGGRTDYALGGAGGR